METCLPLHSGHLSALGAPTMRSPPRYTDSSTHSSQSTTGVPRWGVQSSTRESPAMTDWRTSRILSTGRNRSRMGMDAVLVRAVLEGLGGAGLGADDALKGVVPILKEALDLLQHDARHGNRCRVAEALDGPLAVKVKVERRDRGSVFRNRWNVAGADVNGHARAELGHVILRNGHAAAIEKEVCGGGEGVLGLHKGALGAIGTGREEVERLAVFAAATEVLLLPHDGIQGCERGRWRGGRHGAHTHTHPPRPPGGGCVWFFAGLWSTNKKKTKRCTHTRMPQKHKPSLDVFPPKKVVGRPRSIPEGQLSTRIQSGCLGGRCGANGRGGVASSRTTTPCTTTPCTTTPCTTTPCAAAPPASEATTLAAVPPGTSCPRICAAWAT